MKIYVKAGVLKRRLFKDWLWTEDIPFTEDKGFLGSTFYFDVDEPTAKKIKKIVELNS